MRITALEYKPINKPINTPQNKPEFKGAILITNTKGVLFSDLIEHPAISVTEH